MKIHRLITSLLLAFGLSLPEVCGVSPTERNVQQAHSADAALKTAVFSDDTAAAIAAIRKGADVNTKNDNGDTLLTLKCKIDTRQYSEAKDVEEVERMIQLLLEHGVNVNEKNAWGNTPLTLACAVGNEKIVQLLLEHGADTEAKDKLGTPPIITVVRPHVLEENECGEYIRHDNVEQLIRLLLSHGADINAKNMQGQSVLMVALEDFRSSGSDDTASFCNVIKMLLTAGGEVNDKDAYGCSVLMYALGDTPEVVQLLLDAGADVKNRDNEGRTPLMYACGADNVRILLATGVNVNDKDEEGRTALLHACTHGRKDVAEALLKAGALPNVQAVDGETPLMAAARCGSAEIVNMLIEAGADVKAKDAKGYTALMYAMFSQDRDGAEKCFIHTEGDREHVDIPRLDEGLSDGFSLLLKAGADVNAGSHAGYSPLMLAARYTNGECVQKLLSAGANVKAKDNQQRTALIHAVRYGNASALRVLLAAGGGVNEKDCYAATPLMYAAMQGNSVVMQMLLDAGAAVNEKDCYGRTAYMRAVRVGNEETADLLKQAGAETDIKDKSGHCAEELMDLERALVAGRAAVALKMLKQGETFVDEDVTDWLISSARLRGGDALADCAEYLLKTGKLVNIPELKEAADACFVRSPEGEVDALHYIPMMRADIIYENLAKQYNSFEVLRETGAHSSSFYNEFRNPVWELMTAIATNNTEQVKQELKRVSACSEIKDAFNTHMISWAAYCGNNECVQLLLDAGADVHQVVKTFTFPCIAFATERNNMECMELLLPYFRERITADEVLFVRYSSCLDKVEMNTMLKAVRYGRGKTDDAPINPRGKSILMNYEQAEFSLALERGDGFAPSELFDDENEDCLKDEWVPFAKAATMPVWGQVPKSTRNLVPLSKGDGKYNYYKTGPNTAHLSVNADKGDPYSTRFYELTFTSPTGGTAVEILYKENLSKGDKDSEYLNYCKVRHITFSVK